MACMAESPRATRRIASAGTGWAAWSCQYFGKVAACRAGSTTLIPMYTINANTRLPRKITGRFLASIRRCLLSRLLAASSGAQEYAHTYAFGETRLPVEHDGDVPRTGTRSEIRGCSPGRHM